MLSEEDLNEGRFLVNVDSGEIHDLDEEDPRCNLNQILELKTYNSIAVANRDGFYEECYWCITRHKIKRANSNS